MAWIAIRTNDVGQVAHALQLEGCEEANWASGVDAIYDDTMSNSTIFVTPPLGSWVLVAGLALPQPLGGAFTDKCTPLLANLSAQFGEAQYFLAYPPLDYFGWLRLVDGRLRRAFATGDEGLIWDAGKATAAEQNLGLKFYELRGLDDRQGDTGGAMQLAPTEAQVLALAAHWSIDPSVLGIRLTAKPATGLLARAPSAWRPERALRQAA